MAKKLETASPIVQSGDPVLREKAKDVPLAEISSRQVKNILSRMANALEAEQDGVALAAPQLGIPLRIFVVSHRAFELEEEQKTKKAPVEKMPKKNLVAINPTITKLSKKKSWVPEGCLSVRWLYGKSLRHEKATIRAYDENGKLYTYGGAGLVAQVFQHETDHLNGTLFIDHAKEIEELPPEEIEKIQKKNARV